MATQKDFLSKQDEDLINVEGQKDPIENPKNIQASELSATDLLVPTVVFSKLAQTANQLMNTDVCLIGEFDEDNRKLIPIAHYGIGKDGCQSELSLDSFTAQTISQREPQIREDMLSILENRKMVQALNLKSVLSVPFKLKGGAQGAINVYKDQSGFFDEKAAIELTTFASTVSIVIELARSFVQATTLIEDLQRLDETKNAYIQDVTHQLVSPLQGVRGHAENLLTGRYDSHRYQTTLQSLVESAERCVRMAKNFGYLPDETDDLRLQKQRVRNALTVAARNFQGVAETKSIQIHIAIPSIERLPPFLIDEEIFIQAISNLIDNAVKYSNRYSTITVRAEQRENHALLFFENVGIPISERNTHRVFERFFRANEAKKRVPTGTGIGLTVARSIIQLHGGNLDVEPSIKTENGFRTTFIVTLPIPS
jgi:signal transduction histidine kinase